MSVERARALRKVMSVQEVRLWVRLRSLRADGFHFRRQAPLLGYYPDFICLGRRLVVEVDGPHHEELEQAAHDAYRDQVSVARASKPCAFRPVRCMRILTRSWA